LKKSQKISHKIVVKVGSSLLTGGETTIVVQNLAHIVSHVVRFQEEGYRVILVTSGAIASGLSILGLKKRPKDLASLQAAAAAGQTVLMQAYSDEFAKHGLRCAQILITRDDFRDRQRYNYARDTINTLLDYRIIPIINENDAISVDEIKFGDNDTLSARVAVAVEADGLLILTDIDGLYRKFNVKTGKYEGLVKKVEKITDEIKASACGTDKNSCVGGMSTKIEAAIIGTSAGIPVILTSGRNDEIKICFGPVSSCHDDYSGTLFVAEKSKSRKKHWIAFEAKVVGTIVVDDGAKAALVQRSKSLLAPGIVQCQGEFKKGDVVEIVDNRGVCFAKGKVNFSSPQLQEIKGKKNKDEVVDRDNLVVIG
jgi:glutamate 5-kinase